MALVGVVFVFEKLNSYAADINLTIFNAWTWTVIAILALVYGLSNLMLAQAWHKLLQHLGVSVAVQWAIWAYGVSQISRYLPGNMFHLAGRQAMGAAAGIPHWPLAKSTVWELGLIAAAGAMFGFLVLPVLSEQIPFLIGLVLFVILLIAIVFVLNHLSSKAIVLAFLWYVSFLIISGMIFLGLIELLSEYTVIKVTDWFAFIGVYVVAWLVGLVTPGAPAGIGVRELVLLLLLNGMVGEAELVMAVAFGRLVTASGDALFFIASSIYGRRFFHAKFSNY
ncbi:MAG: hypothetical protein KAZ18_02385 [Acinetobacter sp.]|nr:hypothetical protein [Acinetobacter sp.]